MLRISLRRIKRFSSEKRCESVPMGYPCRASYFYDMGKRKMRFQRHDRKSAFFERSKTFIPSGETRALPMRSISPFSILYVVEEQKIRVSKAQEQIGIFRIVENLYTSKVSARALPMGSTFIPRREARALDGVHLSVFHFICS